MKTNTKLIPVTVIHGRLIRSKDDVVEQGSKADLTTAEAALLASRGVVRLDDELAQKRIDKALADVPFLFESANGVKGLDHHARERAARAALTDDGPQAA